MYTIKMWYLYNKPKKLLNSGKLVMPNNIGDTIPILILRITVAMINMINMLLNKLIINRISLLWDQENADNDCNENNDFSNLLFEVIWYIEQLLHNLSLLI